MLFYEADCQAQVDYTKRSLAYDSIVERCEKLEDQIEALANRPGCIAYMTSLRDELTDALISLDPYIEEFGEYIF